MEAQLSRLDIIRAALAEASPHKATLAEATPHGSAPSSQALWDATGGISAPVIAENEIVAPGMLFVTADVQKILILSTIQCSH